jgi:hypothetical protein
MWLVSKATLVMSNIPGPKTALIFNGKKSESFGALIPGLGDLAFGISAISHADTITMGVQSDLTYVKYPKKLRALIEANYDASFKE